MLWLKERSADIVLKKLISICLSALLIFALSGCDALNLNMEELLVAPMLEGDMHPVQKALEDSVKGDITLKYPASGEYRSAFVMKDIDGSGSEEAFAFYSTTEDSTVTMHINVIENIGGKWESRGDISIIGNGIENVSFADLDGDKRLEIIVGWYVFGTTEKQVGVYTYDKNVLTQRAIEPYTNFKLADLTSDKTEDLVIIHLNTTEKVASAKLLSLSDKGITEAGITSLDGGVNSYLEPVLSTLTDGTPALYIDAVKGSGMLTEIIWYKDSALHGIYNPDTPEDSKTYRSGTVASRDYDLNGIIDIPLSEILISTEQMADSDKVYYTNWTEFSGEEFILRSSAFMNYSDGYSVTVPEELKQNLLVIRKLESRTRFFYNYDKEEKFVGGELFRIVTVPLAEYDYEVYAKNGYASLGRNEGLIYLARVSEETDILTVDYVKSMFDILK